MYRDEHKDNAWITRGIRISCQWEKKSDLLSRNCNDLELKIYYKHDCTVLGRVIRGAKKLLQ